jgi:hypothetical protein
MFLFIIFLWNVVLNLGDINKDHLNNTHRRKESNQAIYNVKVQINISV